VVRGIYNYMIIRAAAVQISPVLYSREGTIEKVVKTIRGLGKQGVQFATFPETVVPYHALMIDLGQGDGSGLRAIDSKGRPLSLKAYWSTRLRASSR
jgi:carbon-nitrogen hydrolase